MSDIPIHVVSFGSEGPPFDDGIPLGEPILKGMGNMCLRGGATTYTGYTPRTLLKCNESNVAYHLLLP